MGSTRAMEVPAVTASWRPCSGKPGPVPSRTTMSPRTIDPSMSEGPTLAPPTGPKAGRPSRDARQATTAGTHRFQARTRGRTADFRRTLPRDLAASALGMGTYLGDCTDVDD